MSGDVRQALDSSLWGFFLVCSVQTRAKTPAATLVYIATLRGGAPVAIESEEPANFRLGHGAILSYCLGFSFFWSIAFGLSAERSA